MSFAAETQSLETQDQLLRRKWIQGRSQISQNLNPDSNCVRYGPKSLPEVEAVIALRRLHELREASTVLSPVEFTAINDNAAHSGAMAPDPLRGTVDDNISAMINRTSEVASCTKGVVDLDRISGVRDGPVSC